MTTTITIDPKEAEGIIKQYLRQQGFEVHGPIVFSVTAGYSDPREYQAPGLTSITAKVSPIGPEKESSSTAFLRSQGY